MDIMNILAPTSLATTPIPVEELRPVLVLNTDEATNEFNRLVENAMRISNLLNNARQFNFSDAEIQLNNPHLIV
jgi:hypothetical protein